MGLSWVSADDSAWFATMTDRGAGTTISLVVEKLPGSDLWDWIVWRRGATNISPHIGNEPSVLLGKIAAEEAAGNWILRDRGGTLQ